MKRRRLLRPSERSALQVGVPVWALAFLDAAWCYRLRGDRRRMRDMARLAVPGLCSSVRAACLRASRIAVSCQLEFAFV